MNTTVAQNKAHRNDLVWHKTAGSNRHNGQHYSTEYTNVLTGQTIRKGIMMTGQDWYIFNADGDITGRHHSLTVAKWYAANN